VQLAGDDVAGVPIAVTQDGNGTVPASVTTDTTGVALFTYTAPSSPQIELVTATMTDAGLTSADGVILTTEHPVTVTISPATVTLAPGQTQQFTATVTGPASGVTWSATGGTITTSGLFTAGTTTGSFSVTARTSSPVIVVGGATVTIAAPVSVEGLYIGELCVKGFFAAEESCIPDMQVAYQCTLQSFVSSGRTCGWFAQGGVTAVPNHATFCQIETDGTTAGGSFLGIITWCRFAPLTPVQASAVFNGSIGNGLLSFTVTAHDPGGNVLQERFSGTKF
jgi:hypothetical protein